jgi:hypothetical protein
MITAFMRNCKFVKFASYDGVTKEEFSRNFKVRLRL